MLTVSWSVRLCAIGVEVSADGIGICGRFVSEVPRRGCEITILIERKPKTQIPIPDVPRFVRAGHTLLPVVRRSERLPLPSDLPYAWLTVIATGTLTVEPDLERAFYRSPESTARRVSKEHLERSIQTAESVCAVIAMPTPSASSQAPARKSI